ncbi:MAG: circadian clock protein KaiB [Candidatus Competibacteraceae bacterium]|nr:circadian clock protein KaiB [Candidatus Competibacteraceae bacterium]MCP5133020.1 circadian clock protein KaiB [Gammaproteobacteria bacterium]
MNKYLLKLYITGCTPQSERAISNLYRICEAEMQGQFEVQIIDVLQSPELAEKDRIIATPTLIKDLPQPLRRIIGDLSDVERVLRGLDIEQIHGQL